MDDGFSYIPAFMLKLPPELYHLWGALRSTMKTGPEVSTHTLCELTGKSERQVFRNLALLAKCGAIQIECKPGQRRKIFCTSETFQAEKLENPVELKEETHHRGKSSAKMAVVDDAVTHDSDTHDSVMCVSGSLSPATAVPDMDDRGKEEKNINKPDNKTPLTPQKNQNTREGVFSVSFLETQSPLPASSSLDLYKILGRFQKAAGTRLALGDLIPSSTPPPEFSGTLSPSLERQWHEFLQAYNEPLGLSQAELEERFACVGKYFALGKSYWVRDGKIIALRWFCNPMHRARAYELIDEAIAWSHREKPSPVSKPSALPAEPTPEERQQAWNIAQETVSQAPESSKEILSRLLGTVFQRQTVS